MRSLAARHVDFSAPNFSASFFWLRLMAAN
jgi:hypothetical protein